VPTFTELYWSDSTITRNATPSSEIHRLVEGRVVFAPRDLGTISFRVFRRSVDDPILLLPTTERTGFPGFLVANGSSLVTHGLEVSATLRVWLLELDGSATWQERPEGDRLARDVLPKLSGQGGLHLRGEFMGGVLPIRAGARLRWQSSFRGERINPEALAYVLNDGPPIGGWAALDAEVRARIGDAIFHLVWENLTDIQAFSSPYTPIEERSVWFGISWQFLN
jgi:hypothetical protein